MSAGHLIAPTMYKQSQYYKQTDTTICEENWDYSSFRTHTEAPALRTGINLFS